MMQLKSEQKDLDSIRQVSWSHNGPVLQRTKDFILRQIIIFLGDPFFQGFFFWQSGVFFSP